MVPHELIQQFFVFVLQAVDAGNWVFAHKLVKYGLEQHVFVHAEAHLNGAAHALVNVLGLNDRILILPQKLEGFVVKLAAGVGQLHPMVIAQKQRDLKFILHAGDFAAEGGLRQIQPLGGLGKAQLLGEGDEAFQIFNGHGEEALSA